MRLEDWRVDISVFRSEFETIPEVSHKDLSWRELDKVVAGAAPVIRAKKAWLPFYVPCLLDKSKPYSGKTAQRFPSGACGPMRSREHVRDMTATMLVMDLDKCGPSEVAGYLRGLRDKGISFLGYTTYSNGAPEKTGYRMRVLVPVDEPLTMERYKAAHDALNDNAFGGRADQSGASLCQQQSVWGCPSDRGTMREYSSWPTCPWKRQERPTVQTGQVPGWA